MPNSKYKTESYHFMVLRRLTKNFPAGEVWHEESPDFLIHAENGVIGVEHTLIHIPAREQLPLQAIESQTDEIISIAQEHAELRGLRPLYVNVSFENIGHLAKVERIGLARDIARTIYDRVAIENSETPFPNIVIRHPHVPKKVFSIHIANLKQDSRHFWKVNRAGWGKKDCIELFQQGIANKEKLIERYLSKCNRCWLLMVAEVKPSGFIHPNNASIVHTYRSSFEKVYFIDLSESNLYLLNTVAI